MPSAIADIRRLARFVEPKNKPAAKAINRKLHLGALSLQDFPERGRLGFETDTRELILTPYMIVYRVRAPCVEILHIYHGREDWMGDVD
jgi:plasmid stabilization system protein ParE